MSHTLNRIMHHWTKQLEDSDEPKVVDLPFNIENFCRENDAALAEVTAENEKLKIHIEKLDANSLEEMRDLDKLCARISELESGLEKLKAIYIISLGIPGANSEKDKKALAIVRKLLEAK